MAYPDDANGDVFRRLESHGFDFSVPHEIEFFAVLRSEEDADSIAKQYLADHQAGDQYANIETKPARDGGIELVLVKPMLVTYENVKQFEMKLAERIAPYEGRLDGWGVMQD